MAQGDYGHGGIGMPAREPDLHQQEHLVGVEVLVVFRQPFGVFRHVVTVLPVFDQFLEDVFELSHCRVLLSDGSTCEDSAGGNRRLRVPEVHDKEPWRQPWSMGVTEPGISGCR